MLPARLLPLLALLLPAARARPGSTPRPGCCPQVRLAGSTIRVKSPGPDTAVLAASVTTLASQGSPEAKWAII